MRQRQFFSRGLACKIARQTWVDATLEKSIVKALMDALPLIGIKVDLMPEVRPCIHCFTFHQEPSPRGKADIYGIIPARLFRGPRPPWARPLYIEAKRPKGGVEGMEQIIFLEERRKDGGVAFFCRSLDEACENLNAAGVIIPKEIWVPKQEVA